MVDEVTESDEGPAIGRNQNVVYTLPLALDSIPVFLKGALERIDPAAMGTQLVVLTPDAESALAMGEAVLGMTGLGGIELLPVTTAARARRMLSMRPVLAIAGPPSQIQALIQSASLKLDAVRTVVLAWGDEILAQAGKELAGMEGVMSEIPRDAARVLVTRAASPAVEQIVERYMRRARRETASDLSEPGTPLELRYYTVSAASRPTALRRLLDELDPPSAVIVARGGASEAEAREVLRRLGYGRDQDPVRLVTGELPPNTHTVILYDPPVSAGEIGRTAAATPVQAFTLVQLRELDFLRSLPGVELIPYASAEVLTSARASDEGLRDELKGVLEQGIVSREIIALEPLLDEFDAVEIAAAALRLLERARAQRDAIQTATPKPSAPGAGTAAGPGNSEGMTKIFITIGTEDGVRAGDIVGAIAGEAGIPGSSIGKVDIRDKHSLVEVETGKVQEVIRKMNGLQIRGRKIAVREERERPPRGDRGERPPRSDRGDRGERGPRPTRGDRPGSQGDRPQRDRGDRPAPRGRPDSRGPRPDRPDKFADRGRRTRE